MSTYNKGEIKLIVQALLAIYISYTVLLFLSRVAINFNGFTAFGVILGAAILYFSYRQSNEFDTFMGITCFMAIPFSIYFTFIA